MTEKAKQRLIPRTVVAGALALGIIGGGYGIANAATGTGSTDSTAAATPATTLPSVGAALTAAAATTTTTPATTPHGFGGQRADETLLTGDTLAKVTAAAKAKVPGGTIVRVETDADGNALYEAHMTAADGSDTTVYVDESFNVVSLETR